MVMQIVIKYRYWCRGLGDNHYKEVEYNDKFSSIPQLKQHFTRFQSAGYLVGYGKRKPEAPWALRAVLVLEWTDDTGAHTEIFSTVMQFVQFLLEHPPLAEAVQYFPTNQP